MKLAIIGLLALGFSAPAFAGYRCQSAAEQAAYKAWYKPGNWAIGRVVNATSVVWSRGGVTSYQVSVENRKPDSTSISYANYSVRVRDTGSSCQVLKVRKF